MEYKLKELCQIYDIEYDRNKFIQEFENYLVKKQYKTLYINEDGYNKFKYLYSKRLLDIFEFIMSKNYDLNIGKWFNDIWFPLFDKKDILITKNILDFLGFSIKNPGVPSGTSGFSTQNIIQQKKNYVKFLKNNNIEYTEIKYDDNLAVIYDYIQEEINYISKNNLSRKTWIILTIKAFKESVMLINTENCKQIRKYYITLEEILFDYSEYTLQFNINTEKVINQINSLELKNKNNEINKIKIESEEKLNEKQKELELANQKSLRIRKYLNNISIKDKKNEWIYIASTTQYAQNNLFKIGSTIRICKRINNYQTGRPEEDAYYYCWIKTCYNSKELDKHINNLLSTFLCKKNRELYCLHYTSLVELVEFIIDNYDQSIEYINNFIKIKLENVITLDPIIPEPIKINNISYTMGEASDNININEFNLEQLSGLLNDILETFNRQNKYNITRKDILESLNKNVNKTILWSKIKNILNWKNSKQGIVWNNNKFIITY